MVNNDTNTNKQSTNSTNSTNSTSSTNSTNSTSSKRQKLNVDEYAAAKECIQAAVSNQEPIALGLIDICNVNLSRIQRWVGVSYRPKTERQSHYGELILCQCYDHIVYLDVTQGLIPIPKMKKLEDNDQST